MSGSLNVKAVARNIMSRYDSNRDGQINLKRSFLNDETKVVSKSRFDDGEKITLTTTVSSRMKLFYAADAQGNNDGKVSQKELENVIKTFDKDNSGDLEGVGFFKRLFGAEKGERQKFNDNFGEEVIDRDTETIRYRRPDDTRDPFNDDTRDPFNGGGSSRPTEDPFNGGGSSRPTEDPFNGGGSSRPTEDPFKNGGSSNSPTNDPFKSGGSSNSSTSDPFN